MASMNEFSNGLGEVSRPRERATYIAFSENAYSSWDQFVNMAPGTWMSIEVSSILLRKRLEMESKHGTGYPVRSFVTSCAAIGRNYQKHERCFVSLDSVKAARLNERLGLGCGGLWFPKSQSSMYHG